MQLTSSKEFVANIMENMVSRASVGGHQRLDLPPGFRFYPTDEELVVHYLKNKVSSRPLPVSIIAEIDLYKFDPWDLPGKAIYCAENEWYFFTPRDRKYPNGARPNRAAGSGYWKATGTDKPIVSCGSSGAQGRSGVKKALVFYKGRPPKGVKTNWIMHEYRLAPDNPTKTTPFSSRRSLRLDDWVLCRIYRKSGHSTARVHRGSDSNSCVEEVFASLPDHMQQEVDAGTQLYNGTRQLPSVGSLSRFIEGPVSHPFLVDRLHVAADQASSASVNTLASPPNSTIINEPRNSWTNLALFDSPHSANTIMKYQAPCSMTSEIHPTSLFARDIDHGRKRISMPNNNMNHSHLDLNGLGSIFPPMHHHHHQQCNNTHNGGGEMADSATLRWPFVDGRPKFPYA